MMRSLCSELYKLVNEGFRRIESVEKNCPLSREISQDPSNNNNVVSESTNKLYKQLREIFLEAKDQFIKMRLIKGEDESVETTCSKTFN